MTLHRVTDADSVPLGQVRAFSVGGTEIIVVNAGGRLCALQRRCPHMGADLGRGTLSSNVLTCPRHAAAFEVTTGKSVNPAKLLFLKFRTKDARVFRTTIENGALMIEV